MVIPFTYNNLDSKTSNFINKFKEINFNYKNAFHYLVYYRPQIHSHGILTLHPLQEDKLAKGLDINIEKNITYLNPG